MPNRSLNELMQKKAELEGAVQLARQQRDQAAAAGNTIHAAELDNYIVHVQDNLRWYNKEIKSNRKRSRKKILAISLLIIFSLGILSSISVIEVSDNTGFVAGVGEITGGAISKIVRFTGFAVSEGDSDSGGDSDGDSSGSSDSGDSDSGDSGGSDTDSSDSSESESDSSDSESSDESGDSDSSDSSDAIESSDESSEESTDEQEETTEESEEDLEETQDEEEIEEEETEEDSEQTETDGESEEEPEETPSEEPEDTEETTETEESTEETETETEEEIIEEPTEIEEFPEETNETVNQTVEEEILDRLDTIENTTENIQETLENIQIDLDKLLGINVTINETLENITEINETVEEADLDANVTDEETEDINETIEEPPLNDTNITLPINFTNVTELITNITIANETTLAIAEVELQYSAEILKPVHWKKTVTVDQEVPILTIELPADAEVIKVVEIEDGETVSIDETQITEVENGITETIDLPQTAAEMDAIEELLSEEVEEITSDQPSEEFGGLLTGNVVLTGASDLWQRFLDWITAGINLITGGAIQEPESSDTKEIVINEVVEEVVIEYLTSAPKVYEEVIPHGKRVTISSELHYEDILAYTSIPETSEGLITLYHIDGDLRKRVTKNFRFVDTNGNDLRDKVEWVVPHLSNQTFEIELLNASGIMDMLVYRGGLSEETCEDECISDEFNDGSLASKWNWFNEPGNWSESGGTLILVSDQDTDFWAYSDDGNFIYQEIDDASFEIETKMSADPDTPVQQAGLYIRQNQNRWIKIGYGYDNCDTGNTKCLESSYKWANGQADEVNVSYFDEQDLWLKLIRDDNQWTSYYSTNGIDWTQHAQWTFSLDDELMVGLYVADGSDSSNYQVEFDYFRRNDEDCDEDCDDDEEDPSLPIFRRHNIATFSTEGVALDVGGNIQYIKVVADPNSSSDEKVLCTRDHKKDLNCQVWDGSWSNLEDLTKNNGEEKNFDVSYQKQTGDAWVCYRDGADTSVPYCNLWNGTSWGTEANALDVNKHIKSLKLFSDPNSEYIALMTKDSDKDVNVQIWNGTVWGDLLEVETYSSTCNRCLSFDGAWESSGDFVAVWYSKGGQELESREYSKTSGWGAQIDSVVTSVAKEKVYLVVDSNPNPNNDELIVAVNDKNGDLAVNNWNGTAWGTESVLASDIGDAKEYNHLFYLAYEQISDYQAVVAYGKDEDEQHYNVWTPSSQTWSSQLDLPDGEDERRWFQLASDPTSDNIMLTVVSKEGDVDTIEWSGTNWENNWTHHESNSDKHYWNAWFAYDYEDEEGNIDITPPDIVLTAPPNNSEDFNGVIKFRFNVTDESPISFCDLILNGSLNQTLVPSGIANVFEVNLTNANYTWSVDCTDSATNTGSSGERIVIVAIPPDVPESIEVVETIDSANNTFVNATVEYIDAGSNEVDYNRTGTERNATLEPGVYNIKITPESHTIQEILISGANLTSDNVTKLIDIDETPETDQFEAALYAVDPSNTSFDYDNITFTVQASGRALYKCTSWNYVNQICTDDRWKKIRTIIPGENYTVTITDPADPGFGEDNKTISVLDRDDYLINNSQSILETAGDLETVNITYVDHLVENMIVYDHNLSAYLDDIHLDDPTDNQNFTELYAINASYLAFATTNVTVTANETAEILVKCDSWNFAAQNCTEGDWHTFKRSINGTYTFTVNSTDPGFAETISGPANTSDSYMRKNRPNRNYGAAKIIRVGRRFINDRYRGIISFNLSHISQNATIANATLRLWVVSTPGVSTNVTHNIHKVQQDPARDWKELQVTWNDYNDSDGWVSVGGDFNSTPTDSIVISAGAGGSYVYFDITSDVQNFVQNLEANFGWIIKDATESENERVIYRSSEFIPPARRPQLIINYSINTAPYINSIVTIPSQNPTEAGITTVNFTFLATDPDGVSNLNDSSAFAQFNRTGEAVRSASCGLLSDINSTTANYSCAIGMQYFDAPGTWNVTVNISDTGGLVAENSSTFTYNQLVAITLSPSNLTWSQLAVNSVNATATNDPVLANNTGNANNNLSVTAFDLTGETTTSDRIEAANFTVSVLTSGAPPLECQGSILTNSSAVTVDNATLPRGNFSIGNGITGQEELYYCLTDVNNSINVQQYSTGFLGPWIVTANAV